MRAINLGRRPYRKGVQMNISTQDIVSNSEMIKNYKACRDKTELSGKLIILKNNRPDAVLFSIDEYEKLSVFIEYMESNEEKDFAKALESLPKTEKRKLTPLIMLRMVLN
jgi:PHD/YefM family antitoxin component YafN of YafNO toxin-antitoxin module